MDYKFIESIRTRVEMDSNDVYHNDKDYASSSTLKSVKKSPLHYANEKHKETDALVFGQAYHAYVLEKEKFENEFYVLDETEILNELYLEGAKKPRSTAKYRQWVAEMEEKNSGKIALSLDDWYRLRAMRARLMESFYIRALINQKGAVELSHYADIKTSAGEDIKLKARPDKFIERKRVCIDLKTTSDASNDGFQREAVKWKYHISAALYLDILENTYTPGLPWTFIFIAQEKTPPYAFNIFEADVNFIGQGRYEYEMLALLWNECKKRDEWPGYNVFTENKYGINSLSLPPYGIKELDFYTHAFKDETK